MTEAGADLHIVVPVYNEAENFPRLYESLKQAVRTPHRVLVVYDREEDSTLPLARPIAERDPSLLMVRNTDKGVLGALQTGLLHPGGRAVLVTMADCSDDLSQVDRMSDLFLGGSHVVA